MTPKEKAQKILKSDRFAVMSGVELLDAGENFAVCSLNITPEHLNAAGAVQGGAIFTLADTAFAMAANNLGQITVSAQSSISYIKGTRGTALTATARMVSSSKRLCTYEVKVLDDLEELIALMTVTGYITDGRIPL